MRIKTATIRNFRSLDNVTVDFESITTFIGPNGVGKSTVLHALDWFFNGQKNQLIDEDCSFGNVDQDIEVSVTFDDLTVADKESLGKYAPEEAMTFTARRVREPGGGDWMSANSLSYPPFTDIRLKTSAREMKDAYAALRSADSDLKLPSAATKTAILDAMTAWESANQDKLEETPEVLQTNFFGFNSNATMAGLFDFVLVTADLRASEESVDGKGSIINRLLERSIDRSAADDEIEKIVANAEVEQQRIYDEKFKDSLNSVQELLNESIGSLSRGRKVAVKPSRIELKAPKTTFSINIQDREQSTSVERQGHGFQRTLLIAALQVLAKSESTGRDGVICLAVEEPELYQHPIQARAFAKVLRALSDDEEYAMQVMYATHSPYFVEPRYFDQIRRLERVGESCPSVRIYSSSIEKVKEMLEGVVDPARVDRQLDVTISTGAISTALFADRVLLVEGDTEVAVLYGIGDREGIGVLEAEGLEIASASGKTNIAFSHAILTSLGIPTYPLFDADIGTESRGRAKQKNLKNITDDVKNMVKQNREILTYLEVEVKDFPEQQAGEKFASFEDELETFLGIEWPEWSKACEDLEAEFGVEVKKSQGYYRQATLSAEGETPKLLADVLERARKI